METLVLDQSYLPVARVHWQRAVTLFFMGKVEIVDEYEDKEIRAVTFAMKMPSVVRFIRSIRSKKKAVKFSRENVYSRDHGKCQYCGKVTPRHEATYDHVLPRAAGGKTEWTNVVISCYSCNQKKASRTPEQAGMRLRSTPVRPKTLPDIRVTIVWRKGDPDSWRAFMRDFAYWNTELEP
jgi:5-methylcytosine-specific restriction endonuclease McrA